MRERLVSLAALAALVALAPAAVAGPAYAPDKHAAAAYAAAKAASQDAVANPDAGNAAAITSGQAIFAAKCATCHGADGKGDGPAAVALDPRPADFTDASRWAFTSVGTKHWIVLNGIKGTGMAPPGVSADDAWVVLAYIEATFEAPARTTAAAPTGG